MKNMKMTDWLITSPTSTTSPTASSSGQQQNNRTSGGGGGDEGKKKHERKQNLGGISRTSTSTGGGSHHQKQPTPSSSSGGSKGGSGATPKASPKVSPKGKMKGQESTGSSPKKVSKSPAGGSGNKRKMEAILPLNKVKLVMKSTPQIDQVGQDVVYLIAKSAELFIETLVTESLYHAGGKGKELSYKNLADYTHSNNKLQFLQDIIPQKMRYKDALREMARQNNSKAKEIFDC